MLVFGIMKREQPNNKHRISQAKLIPKQAPHVLKYQFYFNARNYLKYI